jgi:CDP-glucose 4,6-dehydratase
MVISPVFWKSKKVFLTGHTGFKGSWLALWLQRLGASITGYALPPPTQPSLYHLANVGENMLSVFADVRNDELLNKTMSECRPDVVIHMAAQSLVLPSYTDPVTTYATNVMGTVGLLEAVRKNESVRVVINVTSDKCYENRNTGKRFTETDPMGGFDPYSSSKACAELVTSAYGRSFFDQSTTQSKVAVATVRAGNVIGGGDWSAHRLIPDIVRALLDGRPAVIRNPGSTRPWQHVLEPLTGYLHLAERMWQDGARYAGAWNFGPQDDDIWPVSRVADELVRLWGDGARWEADKRPAHTEATQLSLDCAKARSQLDWSPRLPLPDGLAWTIEWFKQHADGRDMRSATTMQIDRYQDTGKS